jgi:hypothetical protein
VLKRAIGVTTPSSSARGAEVTPKEPS